MAGLFCGQALANPENMGPNHPPVPSETTIRAADGALADAQASTAQLQLQLETTPPDVDAVEPHASVIATALEMIGTPYRRGGTNPNVGFDCSGFVYAMYAQAAGHTLPRVAREQAQATQKIARKELKPGDLVFFNTMRRAFSHVGIYLGDGRFIHAPSRGKRVRVENMNERYWTQRFNGARRVQLNASQAAGLQQAATL